MILKMVAFFFAIYFSLMGFSEALYVDSDILNMLLMTKLFFFFALYQGLVPKSSSEIS